MESKIKEKINTNLKYDQDKLRWELIPLEPIESVVDILTFGAKKYKDNSWKNLENAEERYYAALMRHLVAHRMGELIDPESGRLHLSHVATNAIFLLWFELTKSKKK